MHSKAVIHIHQNKNWPLIIFWIIFSVVFLFLSLFKLNDWPSIYWDEGWTLDAARNWIVHGHLGHYMDGQLITAYSPVRFPMVVSSATSMKIFGIGIWQGRLPNVIYSFLSLLLIFYLCSIIFNRRIGVTALILICLSPLDFNPLFIGRQVLAEMSMFFYLFCGYVFMWLAISRKTAWSIGAAVFFGIALQTKLQVPPFWFISMILAILVSISYKKIKTTRIILGICFGSIMVFIILMFIQNIFMPGSINDPELINILINTVIVVFTVPARETAINIVVLYAIPQLIGLIWGGYLAFRTIFHSKSSQSMNIDDVCINKKIIRTALWGLGASWFLWYIGMALFWMRYLFPPYLIGSIFLGAYFYELSDKINIRLIIKRTSNFLLGREINWTNFQVLIILIAITYIISVTALTVKIKLSGHPANPNLVVEYLNNNIPVGAKVESFESELFFLAPGINFHYPSDLVSMQLVRKLCVDLKLNITYDPLQAQPNYLIIGPYSQYWETYSSFLAHGNYRLETDIGGYQIYLIKAMNSK